MRQVRNGVFETNSSSTHSLTMCMESDYNDWVNGKVYLNEGWWYGSFVACKEKKFVTKEEAINLVMNGKYPPNEDITSMDEAEFEECLREYELFTYENYDNEYLESFENRFTTPNGETVICFGQYGYDG